MSAPMAHKRVPGSRGTARALASTEKRSSAGNEATALGEASITNCMALVRYPSFDYDHVFKLP